MTKLRSLLGLAAFLVLVFAVGLFGSQFGPDPWYAALQKPRWTPPAGIFPPVWTFLYVTMALAGWRVWRDYGIRGAPFAFTVFALQLGLNGLWSYLFFGLHRPGLALLDILLLWLALVVTIILFAGRSPAAGWLLIPYFAWVSYAAALNYAIWQPLSG